MFFTHMVYLHLLCPLEAHERGSTKNWGDMDEIEMYPVIAVTVILPDLLLDAWSHYQECFQAWEQVPREIAHPLTTPPPAAITC